MLEILYDIIIQNWKLILIVIGIILVIILIPIIFSLSITAFFVLSLLF